MFVTRAGTRSPRTRPHRSSTTRLAAPFGSRPSAKSSRSQGSLPGSWNSSRTAHQGHGEFQMIRENCDHRGGQSVEIDTAHDTVASPERAVESTRCRQFRLSDAMILIAGAALSFAGGAHLFVLLADAFG